MQRGDVPLFTSRADSRDLWASEGERITEVFERSAMALVREGLRRMGEEDLARQEALIVTAIVAERRRRRTGRRPAPRKPNVTGRPEAIDLARAVGDMLCRDALQNDGCASWIGITPVGAAGRSSVHPLDVTLYDGLSGCSLFLAYLGALAGDESYQRVARKAVTLLRRHLERGRAGGAPVLRLGAFSGLGGIVYTLAHLAVLWNDASLIDEAEALARGRAGADRSRRGPGRRRRRGRRDRGARGSEPGPPRRTAAGCRAAVRRAAAADSSSRGTVAPAGRPMSSRRSR